MGALETALSSIRGNGSSSLEAPTSSDGSVNLSQLVHSIRIGAPVALKGKPPSELYPRQEPEKKGPLDILAEQNAPKIVQPLVPGNIDLANRPRVKNPDGSISTVRSMSVNMDGKEVLIPTVSDDGRILTPRQAVDLYRETGKHLGIFNDADSATQFAKKLHEDQAVMVAGDTKPPSGFPIMANDKLAAVLQEIRAKLPGAATNALDRLAVKPARAIAEATEKGVKAADTALNYPSVGLGGIFELMRGKGLPAAAESIDQGRTLGRAVTEAVPDVPGTEHPTFQGTDPLSMAMEKLVGKPSELMRDIIAKGGKPALAMTIDGMVQQGLASGVLMAGDAALFKNVFYPSPKISAAIPFARLRQLQGGAAPSEMEAAVLTGQAGSKLRVPRINLEPVSKETGMATLAEAGKIYKKGELEALLSRDRGYDVALYETKPGATEAPQTGTLEAVPTPVPTDPLSKALFEVRGGATGELEGKPTEAGTTELRPELQPTGQTPLVPVETGPASEGLQNNVFPPPTHPFIESIAPHPDFVKVTNDALEVVNRHAKERGITPTPEFTKELWGELHDELGRVRNAPAAERVAVAKEVMAKYPNIEKDFIALKDKLWSDRTEGYFEKFIAKTPIEKAPAAPAALKLTKGQAEWLEKSREQMVRGEPGYRHVVEAGENDPTTTKTVLGFPSSFPDWYKNSGWASKDVIGAIDKALNGRPLTPRQHSMVSAALDDRTTRVRELIGSRMSKEITAGELKKGDTFKIEGEKFTVIDDHPDAFPGKVTLKDGRTFTIQGDEPLKIDRGTLESTPAGAEERTPKGDPLTLAIQEARQPKAPPAEAQLPGMPAREMPTTRLKAEGQVPTEDLLVAMESGKELPAELPLTGGGSHASKGGFTPEFESGDAEVETVKIKPVDMPELVELAKEISGNFPEISKRMGVNTRGLFLPGQGIIRLRPEIFKDPKTAAQVLAHEMGHLIDWLPDKTMARGNILGRLYTLRKFMKDTYGNLEEGGQVMSFRNKELREELMKLGEWWRPYNKEHAPASFKRYRASAEELYADALSVLLNAPKELETRAPKFFKTFFEALDKKSFVKDQFFALQERLGEGFETVMTRRLKNIEEGGVKSEALFRQKREEKLLRDRHIYERTRMAVDDVFYPIVKRVHDLEAMGVNVPEEKNPKFSVDELTLADNRNHTMLRQIDDEVNKPLKEAGLDTSNLHPYMFAKRVLADRSQLANPYGTSPKNAEELLTKLQADLGPEKYAALEAASKKFHDIIWKSVEEAVELGTYNSEVFETKLVPNKDAYVAFTVLDYASDFVPAGIKAQIGTLKEVGDTFLQTTLKMISLNRLNALQATKRDVRALLQEYYPKEISKAKVINPQDKIHQFKREENTGHLKMLEDGKMVAYNVDPLVAESFEKFKAGDIAMIGGMLRKVLLNDVFKALYITYNPGFGLAFNPIRDFKRTYRSIPGATMGKLLGEYWKALPIAIRKNMGVSDALVNEMIDSKAVSAEFGDFMFDPSDDKYTRMLEHYGVLKTQEGEVVSTATEIRKKLLKPIIAVLEGIRFAGSVLETMPKIAGYSLRKAEGETGARLAYNTRNYVGTPNFMRSGYATPITNAIWMFSNIMKEGMKADFTLATSPKTRNGYWWKTVKMDLLPKMAMMAAAAGAAGKYMKGFYDRVPEYDKTNYIVVPLGMYGGGDYGWKAIYMRVPHDETNRLVAAVFWKMFNAAKGDPKALNQIFDFGAGQLPNVAPTLNILSTWGEYLSGKNPYSSFKGTNVMSDLEYKAGGWPALKKMVFWTANQSGQVRFATYDDTTKTTTEHVLESTPLLNRLIKISDYGMKEIEKKAVAGVQSEKAKERLEERDIKRKIENAIRSGKSDFDEDLKTGVEKMGFNAKDFKEIIQKGTRSELENRVSDLPFDEAMAVYKALGDDERKVLGPIIAKKFQSTAQRGELKTLERALK